MAHWLVTGGAGFVGSHLVRALLGRGDAVRVLDDLSSGREENLEGLDVELVRGSITDREACRAAVSGVTGVFHQAAQVSVPKSVEDPERSYLVNVMGTLQVLEACRRGRVGRVVFAASSAAYGDSDELPKREDMPPRPLSPYASGKLAAEDLLRVWGTLHGMRTVSLRYFNVFGPRQLDDNPYTGVIALFARALRDGQRATIHGDGSQTRDLTYVDNVVAANIAAMERELPPGVVINVGCGERVSILELHRELARALGVESAPVFAPPRAGDVRHSQASIARARDLLGYAPAVGWREGLARTLAWYRERAGAAR
jgi:nucleoside-diphosphate-sugar epimerase